MSEEYIHVPVLKEEVISHLNINPNGIYLDGTIGLGGHSSIIISQLSNQGHLIGIDKDDEALEICKKALPSTKTKVSLFKDSYHNINSILLKCGVDMVNGIILDLGLSSLQLDSKNRGFSYLTDSRLDMRFNQSQHIQAKNLLNELSEGDLADVIYFNGEERRSRKIAKNIVKMRPINSVFKLVESIKKSSPPYGRNKTLARVFQAIRIEVNNELDILDEFLSSFYKKLLKGGRIAIISFHSLEDRRVKRSFKTLKSENLIKIISKKPITPSYKEVENNSRSRSAKLRVAERI